MIENENLNLFHTTALNDTLFEKVHVHFIIYVHYGERSVRAVCVLVLFIEMSHTCSFENAFTLARISSEKFVMSWVFRMKGPEIWFVILKVR